MLKKREIIERCMSLGLETWEYGVGYGAAMVLHGVTEETRDIDIYVTVEVFRKLAGFHVLQHFSDGEPYICIDGLADIFAADEPEMEKVMIQGVPVLTLKEIVSTKKKLGRAKDMDDIERIERFIKSQEQNGKDNIFI